ncbi:MAG: hypothetical protein M1831_005831 [Alyxoria varia]|nr:MAG: hypothetical protein M1831_005831 [Alyxoria varia]
MPFHSPYYAHLKHRIFIDPVYLNIANTGTSNSASTPANNDAEAPWHQHPVPVPFILASALLPTLVIFTVVVAVSFLVRSHCHRRWRQLAGYRLVDVDEDVELGGEVGGEERYYGVPMVKVERTRADEERRGSRQERHRAECGF